MADNIGVDNVFSLSTSPDWSRRIRMLAALARHWFNAGPTSQTLAQHWISVYLQCVVLGSAPLRQCHTVRQFHLWSQRQATIILNPLAIIKAVAVSSSALKRWVVCFQRRPRCINGRDWCVTEGDPAQSTTSRWPQRINGHVASLLSQAAGRADKIQNQDLLVLAGI